MAKKCNQRRRRHEGGERIPQRNNIFIFIEGRPVDQLHLRMIFQRNWPLRQSVQPLQILLGEMVPSPKRGQAGHGIKILQIDQADGGFVVIAADEDFAKTTRAVCYFVRTRAVTPNVPQIRYQIERWSSGQRGFQRFQIGMNVTKQKYAHESPDKLPIIDLEGVAVPGSDGLFVTGKCRTILR